MNTLSILDSVFGCDGFPGMNYSSSFGPNVDVFETKDSFVLEMELPGKSEKDVEIKLNEDVLTISSVKVDTNNEQKNDCEEVKWLLKERSSAEFKRSFTLPKNFDSEKIEAEFKNGILSVKIGKKEISGERKITISVA